MGDRRRAQRSVESRGALTHRTSRVLTVPAALRVFGVPFFAFYGEPTMAGAPRVPVFLSILDPGSTAAPETLFSACRELTRA